MNQLASTSQSLAQPDTWTRKASQLAAAKAQMSTGDSR
jgi:hypothetical protein